MSYKTIIVCLANQENAKRLTQIACGIARRFDSHLIGLHIPQAMEIYRNIAMHIPADVTQLFNETQDKQAEEIRQTFLDETKTEDFVSEWRCVKALSSNTSDRLVEHAQCADLVVMAQADDDHDPAVFYNAQKRVIEESGRPVLIIPSHGDFDTIGDNVLIGWSATREATRAAHDAIPFMQNGGKANVFWVSPSQNENTYLAHTGHELATCLDRNGVKANVAHRVQSNVSIGDEILNEASDSGADLIVSGAYGHSRVYDFMVGATTPHLMKHMTVPVLFSC